MTRDSTLTLAFTGDISLPFLAISPGEPPDFSAWPEIKAQTGTHDFLVGNLECCFVPPQDVIKENKAKLAAPAADATAFLRNVGFTDLSLANNHMLDCGPQAINTTRERLARVGIRCFGAGRNRDEAEAVEFVKKGAHQVAFISACDFTEYYAGRQRPGIASLRKKRLGRQIRTASKQADLVIVIIHADIEFSQVPGIWRQRLSRWLVDQGAHLVIQHHPHVLQGIESYHGGLIAYSLGNFIFELRGNKYQENKPGVFDSAILKIEADLGHPRPKLSYDVVPLRIGDDNLPYHVTAESHDAAMARIETLSALLESRTDYRRAWFARCRREAIDRCLRIYYALGRGQPKRAWQEAWRLIAQAEDRRWLLGLLSAGYL